MQKEKLGIVILNYINYQETICCYHSIRGKIEKQFPIVIVDNGSNNESYEILTRTISDKNVHFVKSDINLGFARGNNLGIYYLREKCECDFILLLNSDTVVEDKHYIERLLDCYENGVGVIGSNVLEKKGSFTQPSIVYPYFDYSLFCLVKYYCKYYHIHFGRKYNSKGRKGIISQIGCAILLTPDYFQFYKGLYSKTFLYGEEQILCILLSKAGLLSKFCNNTYIRHNEAKSTSTEFQYWSRGKERKSILGYKNVLLVSCKSLNRLQKET